jgi:hypothetical protein
MKLTESRIKEIILEELQNLFEEEPVPDQQQDEPKGSYTTSDLKKELISLGQKIQSVQGLDSTELKLVSGIIGFVTKIASEKSGATALKRIYDMLEKFDAQ